MRSDLVSPFLTDLFTQHVLRSVHVPACVGISFLLVSEWDSIVCLPLHLLMDTWIVYNQFLMCCLDLSLNEITDGSRGDCPSHSSVQLPRTLDQRVSQPSDFYSSAWLTVSVGTALASALHKKSRETEAVQWIPTKEPHIFYSATLKLSNHV